MEDFSGHTLRELLTLARERLGSSAAGLKTREELLAALGKPAPETGSTVELVTRDFFKLREK